MRFSTITLIFLGMVLCSVASAQDDDVLDKYVISPALQKGTLTLPEAQALQKKMEELRDKLVSNNSAAEVDVFREELDKLLTYVKTL